MIWAGCHDSFIVACLQLRLSVVDGSGQVIALTVVALIACAHLIHLKRLWLYSGVNFWSCRLANLSITFNHHVLHWELIASSQFFYFTSNITIIQKRRELADATNGRIKIKVFLMKHLYIPILSPILCSSWIHWDLWGRSLCHNWFSNKSRRIIRLPISHGNLYEVNHVLHFF